MPGGISYEDKISFSATLLDLNYADAVLRSRNIKLVTFLDYSGVFNRAVTK